jgi:hypothetical protein
MPWDLPAYTSRNQLIDFSPINQAVSNFNQGMQQDVENERARRKLAIDEGRFAEERKAQEIARVGRIAQVVDNEPDPQRRAAMMTRLYQLHPTMQQALTDHGVDPNDHGMVPKFLQAQAGLYDPNAGAKAREEINRLKSASGLADAQAEYYRNRANLDTRERWKLDPTRNIMVNAITGETRPIYAGNAPQARDPLAHAGIDDSGRLIPPPTTEQQPPPPGNPTYPPPPQFGGGDGDDGRLPPRFGPQADEQQQYPPPSRFDTQGPTSGVPGVSIAQPQGDQPPQGEDRFRPPMRLGRLTEDIDRSMRLDEGRGAVPQGVQVAQAGPSNTTYGATIPGAGTIDPRISAILKRSQELERTLGKPPAPRGSGPQVWVLDERGIPSAMPLGAIDSLINPQPQSTAEPPPGPLEGWRSQAFGVAGNVSPNVRGIVTDAGKSRRTDVPATREAQSQRAIEGATQEQKDRLLKLRQNQELWTGIWKKEPRAGFYYGEGGEEIPKTDRVFKGDRETQSVARMHLENIDRNAKLLLSQNWLQRSLGGNTAPGEGLAGAIGSIPAAIMNTGETAQAFSEMKQAGLNIAYLLSGKQVAVKEMENFMNAYSPAPNDSETRIRMKVDSIKRFYNTLLDSVKNGKPIDETDVRRAAASSVDVRSRSTEDLIRSLPSGR